MFPQKAIIELIVHPRINTVLESKYCSGEVISVKDQRGLLKVIRSKESDSKGTDKGLQSFAGQCPELLDSLRML